VQPLEQAGSWRRAGVGLVTYSVGPGLGAIVLLQGRSSLRHRLTVLCFVDPVGHLSLVAAGFKNTVTVTGGTSQDVAVQALVCSSAVAGTMCCRVVASFIHLIRSLVWGCGRDQSFYARVGCIRLQLRCEHPCPSTREAIQYCDHGPVWFGTRFPVHFLGQ
jgi:hypothetical protein